MLYPLKFKPILKAENWGGTTLSDLRKGLGVRIPKDGHLSESVDISTLPEESSIIANGFLKDNELSEILEVYMEEISGEDVFPKYGISLPVKISYLSAEKNQPIHLHPFEDELLDNVIEDEDDDEDDDHDCDCGCEDHHHHHEQYFGKTEIWYVTSAKKDSFVYVGLLNSRIDREKVINAISEGTFDKIMNTIPVKAGDVFRIPSGVPHCVGEGVDVIEISLPLSKTITASTWHEKGDVDVIGTLDKMDYESGSQDYICPANLPEGNETFLTKCDNFSVSLLNVENKLNREYLKDDKCRVLYTLDKPLTLKWDDNKDSVAPYQAVLIPAVIKEISLEGEGRVLEITPVG